MKVKGQRVTSLRQAAHNKGSPIAYAQALNRPRKPADTLLYKYEREGLKDNPLFQVFTDKQPHYNAKLSSYAYDFKGRVKEASVKNFQLVPLAKQGKGEVTNDFVLQFGKRNKDDFILDLQYPLSIFQGFGLALAAFDID